MAGKMEERQLVQAVLYGGVTGRRFTQDSPVLPDVWLAYLERPSHAAEPDKRDTPVDLLIEPWLDTPPYKVAQALRHQLRGDQGDGSRARVATNRTTVIATLTLKELVNDLLPLTGWYQEKPQAVEVTQNLRRTRGEGRREWLEFDRSLPRPDELWEDLYKRPQRTYPYPKLLSLIRIAGLIAYLERRAARTRVAIDDLVGQLTLPPEAVDAEHQAEDARRKLAERMLKGFREKFGDLLPESGLQERKEDKEEEGARNGKLVYGINLNRRAMLALKQSLRTVKADAATSVFSIDCSRLTWAIVDCGIDALHPAFLDWSDAKDAANALVEAEHGQDDDGNKGRGAKLPKTRVTATYDFSYLRELLLGEADKLPDRLKAILARMRKNRSQRKAAKGKAGANADIDDGDVLQKIRTGQSIDWDALRPLIQIPDERVSEYVPPVDGHGTHVAGIVGADWRRLKDGASARAKKEVEVELTGVCRDIKLIDVRVCKEDGSSDEFVIMSALQFLRHLNANSDFPAVHGCNMSLSLIHDASNYACGQTPVCKEAERTVASGIVVVAAAGNLGFRWLLGENQKPFQQYFLASITDPGNAEGVITVGSTHRIEPHTYGVSYFSSRGPTGDGRHKPDLVAPGEKIFGPTLDGAGIRLDGTSMAAPHVSGAAALLMARHVELMGQPQRIKQILCSTATDLGRERYFQGAGLVDILRAIQSV